MVPVSGLRLAIRIQTEGTARVLLIETLGIPVFFFIKKHEIADCFAWDEAKEKDHRIWINSI